MPYFPSGFDALYVKPLPGKHFRWISMDAKRQRHWLMNFGDRPGYKLLQGSNPEETMKLIEEIGLSTPYFNSALNAITFGDLILAWLPEEEYQRRREEIANETASRMDSVVDQYYEAATRRGIRPFVREIEEIVDRKMRAQADYGGRVGYTGPSKVAA